MRCHALLRQGEQIDTGFLHDRQKHYLSDCADGARSASFTNATALQFVHRDAHNKERAASVKPDN
jgi:hypothetical protein